LFCACAHWLAKHFPGWPQNAGMSSADNSQAILCERSYWPLDAKLVFRSLLYVSESLLEGPSAVAQIDAIVDVSRFKNKILDISGALLCTSESFAQILEGEHDSIDELMESIHRDPRHRKIIVLFDVEIDRRRFDGWSLAYAGPSTYVAKQIAPHLRARSDAGDGVMVSQLVRLLRQFVRGAVAG
jgi:hypothetical protein